MSGGEPIELPSGTAETLARVARRIADGFSGEITLQVSRNGGIMKVAWTEIETGETLASSPSSAASSDGS